ncbi:hypothetical protein H0H93_013689 [Arthromyces matolae]|nr:hypothetical protein H0H93_013689 [Arthromyces matolae]
MTQFNGSTEKLVEPVITTSAAENDSNKGKGKEPGDAKITLTLSDLVSAFQGLGLTFARCGDNAFIIPPDEGKEEAKPSKGDIDAAAGEEPAFFTPDLTTGEIAPCPHVCQPCKEQHDAIFKKAAEMLGDTLDVAPVPAPQAPAPGPAVLPPVAASSFLSSNDHWYCVTIGREVGVFRGWSHVQRLVSGVPGNCFKKWPTQAAAQEAFDNATAANVVEVRN